MARKIVKSEALFDVELATQEWLNTKTFAADATARAAKQKKRLEEYVDTNGYTDNGGHIWFDLPDGRKLKHEKRVGKYLSAERTEELLREKDLWEECVNVITVEEIDESKVLAANFTNQITDEELKALYDENVVWAFLCPK